MSNSLGATNGTLIARRTLATLLAEFPFLRQVTADFSDEAALFNQPIKIKLPSAMAADDYDEADGYEQGEANQTDVDLMIDKHPHVTYGFNDRERTSHDPMLIERFARNASHALGQVMVDALLALGTAANFPNVSFYVADVFERDKLMTISKKFDLRKLPGTGRFALLGSDHYKTLAQDTTIIANAGSPSNTVRTGQLGDVDGFNVLKYPHMPTNDEGLVGLCGVPEGLLIATRVPHLPDPKTLGGGSIENVTDENTGLTLQVRSWYDFGKGKEFRTYTFMFGVAKGNPDCIERVVDQSPD